MAILTPVTYFASVGSALPTVISDSAWYYDANETTTFTDQSGNGNNGTENTLGSGGSSSLTHNTSGTFTGAYWSFRSPSPLSETRTVDTGYSIGSNTGPWSVMWIASAINVTENQQVHFAQDGGSDNLILIFAASNDRFLARASDGSRKDITSSQQYVANRLYCLFYTYDGSGRLELYVNNTLSNDLNSSVNVNISANTIIGRPILNAGTTNNFDWCAGGFWPSKELNSTERDSLYDYYDAIYGF